MFALIFILLIYNIIVDVCFNIYFILCNYIYIINLFYNYNVIF